MSQDQQAKRKTCTRCLVCKPLERQFFWKRKTSAHGFSDVCRCCKKKEYKSKRMRRQVRTADFVYVRQRLAQQIGISTKTIPTLLVEVEQLRILITREIKKRNAK